MIHILYFRRKNSHSFPETFLQATSDKTASANFTQTGHSINLRYSAGNVTNGKTGHSPYYQWGRKDAFRSYEYNVAPADGTTLVFKTEPVTVGKSIQTPTTFYNGGDNKNYSNPYSVSFYYNAWNAPSTTFNATTDNIEVLNKTIKTVYDPCPVGYTVPPANTFIGFNNSNYSVSGNGRLYTSNSTTLYFPTLGFRVWSTATVLNTYTNDCVYWTAVSGAANNARFLYNANPVFVDYFRANGCPVRPVREK